MGIKSITIFGNSTIYTPMKNATEKDDLCCLDLLENYTKSEKIEFHNYCMNGMTVMEVKHLISKRVFKRSKENWIIIHLGICETGTHPPINFLYSAIHRLHFYGVYPEYQTFVIPEMYEAAKALIHGEERYFCFLTSNQFCSIFDQILDLLEGFSVIVVGFNKPNAKNNDVKERWIEQAKTNNEGLIGVCEKYNNVRYLDLWNECNEFVVDTNHMTKEGHIKYFDLLREMLEE